MPIHNEARDLRSTIDALVLAVDRSGFAAELVLVDDGSSDESADVARSAVAGRIPLRVLTQRNSGRFEARRAGVEASTGEWTLLLDGRVRIRPDALAFVRSRLAEDERVWTGHVDVAGAGNPFGTLCGLLAELAWAEYFAHPGTTSFGPA